LQNRQAWELAGSQEARVTARSATRMRVFLFMGRISFSGRRGHP
jgi:hypothetical protein